MAGAIALTPVVADAATQCFTKAEQDAALVRQLKAEMMVIALTCRGYTQLDTVGYYDRFVLKHRPELQNSSKVLQTHFKRYYGADDALTRLEKYDTVLANASSTRNMDLDRDGFCARSVDLLAGAVDSDPRNLVEFSTARVAQAQNMPLCTARGKPVVQKAAVKTPPAVQRAAIKAPPSKAKSAVPARAPRPAPTRVDREAAAAATAAAAARSVVSERPSPSVSPSPAPPPSILRR
jgi:hypothetical protein